MLTIFKKERENNMQEIKNKEYQEIFSKSKENWEWFRKNREKVKRESS